VLSEDSQTSVPIFTVNMYHQELGSTVKCMNKTGGRQTIMIGVSITGELSGLHL
jgi:hypothetical protein